MASVGRMLGYRNVLTKTVKLFVLPKRMCETETERRFVNPSIAETIVTVPQSQTSTLASSQTDSKRPLMTFAEPIPLVVDARRVDPATVKQVHYLDTLTVMKTLEKHGFSRENAEGLTRCLADLVSTTLEHQSRHMVSKTQQEIVVQQMMSEISSVKKDMVLLQKTEFSTLKNQTEKQSFEIQQIKDMLEDEIVKMSGKITLDINLERGRAIEAHAENEKKLQRLHNKIETEIAHLRTTYEQYRNDVFKYAGGTVLTCAGLCLGIIRMWS